MRYRAGTWGTGNVVISGVFLPAFCALGVLAWRWALVPPRPSDGSSRPWSAVAGTASLAVAALMVLLIAQGVSTWRPVEVGASAHDGRPVVRVPVFSVRHGFGWVVVPVADVAEVELAFHHEGRQSRWQLVVVRADGTSIPCDSITSGRGSRADVRTTPAGRVVEDLREHLAAVRRA